MTTANEMHTTLVERGGAITDLIHEATVQFANDNLGAGYGYLKQAKTQLDELCEAL